VIKERDDCSEELLEWGSRVSANNGRPRCAGEGNFGGFYSFMKKKILPTPPFSKEGIKNYFPPLEKGDSGGFNYSRSLITYRTNPFARSLGMGISEPFTARLDEPPLVAQVTGELPHCPQVCTRLHELREGIILISGMDIIYFILTVVSLGMSKAGMS
jgi:hypothetical protein